MALGKGHGLGQFLDTCDESAASAPARPLPAMGARSMCEIPALDLRGPYVLCVCCGSSARPFFGATFQRGIDADSIVGFWYLSGTSLPI